ncbi:hypothetical protein U9M48_012289 [Paspalum notatum var. saurae]|uniref:Uncharacterized protein n=1 Tax=Paspalum notatum var. saurae TaxID=547442 RepID=A0AAQ3SX62_PASNO
MMERELCCTCAAVTSTTRWLPSSDPLWKTMRGIAASHVFSPCSLATTRAVRERKVRDLLGYLRGRAGEVVDVKEAVNLVSSALFFADVVDVGAASALGFQRLVEEIIDAMARPSVSDLFPFLRALDLQGWRRLVAGSLGKILRILDDIIDRRLAEARGRQRHAWRLPRCSLGPQIRG